MTTDHCCTAQYYLYSLISRPGNQQPTGHVKHSNLPAVGRRNLNNSRYHNNILNRLQINLIGHPAQHHVEHPDPAVLPQHVDGVPSYLDSQTGLLLVLLALCSRLQTAPDPEAVCDKAGCYDLVLYSSTGNLLCTGEQERPGRYNIINSVGINSIIFSSLSPLNISLR